MQTRKIWEVFALENSKGPERDIGWPSRPTGSVGREGRKKNKMKWGKNSQEFANSDGKQVSGLNWMQCGPF